MSIGQKITLKITLAGLFVTVAFIAFSWQDKNGSLWIFSLFLLFFSVSFAIASAQDITLPVKKFIKKAESLSRGDFAGRFYIQDRGELEYLGRVFDKIAHQVGKNKSDFVKMKGVFDQRAEFMSQSTQETIGALELKVKNRSAELSRVVLHFGMLNEELKEKDLKILDLKNKISKLEQG